MSGFECNRMLGTTRLAYHIAAAVLTTHESLRMNVQSFT